MFDEYKIFLVLWSPGGSYDPRTGIIKIRADEQGNPTSVRKNKHETIVHEIVHIGIEELIVQKYKLKHWEKEYLVDTICKKYLGSLMPEYMSQRIVKKMDKYVTKETIKNNLPSAIEKYISSSRKPTITLYHGSPWDAKVLEPHAPRGSNEFERMKAVFFTDTHEVASIYALARDKERKRRGWTVFKGKLYTLEGFEFNDVGYVYVYTTDDYVTHPFAPVQYAVPHKVKPEKKITVYPKDIQHLHVILTKEEMRKLHEKIKQYIKELQK